METILFEISIVLFFSILGYLLSQKFRQPTNIGIILMGIIIGPSLLGLVSYSEIIRVIARIGSIILLFIAGLSSNFKEIYTKKAFLVALGGVVLPFIGGFFIAMIFNFNIATSLFIGATLTATCLAITTALLREIGKINTETAKLILGAAVIDDILGLISLSIVTTFPTISIIPIMTTILLAVIFIFAASYLGDKFIPRLVDYFDIRVGTTSPKLTFMLGMGIAFGFSFIAEYIGLAAIVGAFLAGVCLSSSRNVNFFHSGAEYLEAIFVSIFFVSVGIIVELNALLTAFWLIIALTITAITTKIIGCGLVANKLGFNRKDSVIVGTGMSPRGEIAFIIAIHGLMLGLISREIYSAIVFMSFLTTLITLILLKWLYGVEKQRIVKQSKMKTKQMKIKVIRKN